MKTIVNTLDVSDIKNFNKIFSDNFILKNIKPKRKLVLKEIKNADAYLASAAIRIDKEFLDCAPNLKVVGSPSTGVDHMDLNLIKKKNIVCYDISKEYNLINSFTATSELAFGLILNLNRKINPAIIETKKGIWGRENYQGFQLFGKTFGILGLGRLGLISANIAKGFGMKVIANDIKKINKKNIKMVELNELAKLSDIVSIHVHLNNSTKNIINDNFFSLMKSSAILINTARGKIINEKALLNALKNKKIAGAGLDVIDGEWLDRENKKKHALIRYANEHNNLLITPHIGGATKESIEGARIFMAKKVANFLMYNKSQH